MLKLDDMAVNLSYCQLQEVLMPEMKSFRVFALSCIATFSLELAENPLKFCKNSQLWTRLSIGQCFVAGGPQLSLCYTDSWKDFYWIIREYFPDRWCEVKQNSESIIADLQMYDCVKKIDTTMFTWGKKCRFSWFKVEL